MLNRDVQSQLDFLILLLSKSEVLVRVLNSAAALGLPNWYLGAGAVCQTVWNQLHGFPIDYGIKDYDLVYFDPDLSAEKEKRLIHQGEELFADLPITLDIVNEARVHLWYADAFGKEIDPYSSTEDAINTWPTTATSVGVRKENERVVVYAPYGLNDLLGMIVRANKTLISREVYENKVMRWSKTWPNLTVIPWDDHGPAMNPT